MKFLWTILFDFSHVSSSVFSLVFTGFSGLFIRLCVSSLFITFLLNVTIFVTKIVTMKKLLPGKDNSFLILSYFYNSFCLAHFILYPDFINMIIPFHRHGYVCVSPYVLQALDIHTAFRCSGTECMPQYMWMCQV